MGRLIKAEIYKLYKNTTFRVICIIVFILSGLTIFSASDLMITFLEESMNGITPENQAEIMNMVKQSEDTIVSGNIGFNMAMSGGAYDVFFSAFGSGVIEIFIGVLVGGMMAKEYTQGTMKNFLAYGKSRMNFYISKFIAIVLAVLIITSIMVVFSVFTVYLMNGWGKEITSQDSIKIIFTFIASIIASSSVVSMIMIVAILTKGNGATIGITVILFILIPNIIGVFYGKNEVFDLIYEFTPYYNNALAVAQKSQIVDILKSIMVSIFLIITSLGIGSYIFKRQDIK